MKKSVLQETMLVLKDFNKSPEEREAYINTLTEEQIRNIMLDLCYVWASKSK